jgi:hypothetical protein
MYGQTTSWFIGPISNCVSCLVQLHEGRPAEVRAKKQYLQQQRSIEKQAREELSRREEERRREARERERDLCMEREHGLLTLKEQMAAREAETEELVDSYLFRIQGAKRFGGVTKE